MYQTIFLFIYLECKRQTVKKTFNLYLFLNKHVCKCLYTILYCPVSSRKVQFCAMLCCFKIMKKEIRLTAKKKKTKRKRSENTGKQT